MQIRFSRFQVVGAILTVLAVLAFSVSPAFGQDAEQGDDAQYSAVCQNLIGAIGDITTGDNTATTNASNNDSDDSNAAAAQYAEIAQDSGVSIEQLNECLNGAAGDDTDGTDTDDTDTTDADSNVVAAAVDSPEGVKSASIPEVKTLVNTGGLPLLGLAVIGLAVSVVGISVLTGGSRR